jgi:hypothetical protein
MEFVPFGSDMEARWKDYHSAKGWPWLPDAGKMAGCFWPKGGPPEEGAKAQMVGFR